MNAKIGQTVRLKKDLRSNTVLYRRNRVGIIDFLGTSGNLNEMGIFFSENKFNNACDQITFDKSTFDEYFDIIDDTEDLSCLRVINKVKERWPITYDPKKYSKVPRTKKTWLIGITPAGRELAEPLLVGIFADACLIGFGNDLKPKWQLFISGQRFLLKWPSKPTLTIRKYFVIYEEEILGGKR
jgi:hypothetical protein